MPLGLLLPEAVAGPVQRGLLDSVKVGVLTISVLVRVAVEYPVGNTLPVGDQVSELLSLAVLLAVSERELGMPTVCVRVCILVPLAVEVQETDICGRLDSDRDGVADSERVWLLLPLLLYVRDGSMLVVKVGVAVLMPGEVLCSGIWGLEVHSTCTAFIPHGAVSQV